MRPGRAPATVLRLALALLVSCGGPPAPRSLLLVTIDTLRADRLGCYGHARARTPVLDGLAARGTLFLRAYAAAPTTLTSHASILTGLYPPAHGIRDNGLFRLPSTAVTLAEILREQGFFTGAVVAANPLTRRFGLDQGFEVYEEPDERSPLRKQLPAQEVTRRAKGVLDRVLGRPFFLWVHYFDPHHPYEPPPAWRTGESESERYDDEIAYVDHSIGELLDAIDRLGHLDETAVLVTADHGESLGQYGESYHSVFVYDATIRVPLLLAGPGIGRGVRVSRPVTTLDLFATVLELAGVGADGAAGASSRSLLAPRGEGAVYSESMTPAVRYGWSGLQALRTDEWLYIRAPEEELYRLDGSDPGQGVNLARTFPDVHARMRRALDEIVGGLSRLEESAATDPPGKEDRKILEELGYLVGHADPELPSPASGPDPKEMIEVSERLYEAVDAVGGGDEARGLEILEWVVERDPRNVTAWMNLGMLHEGKGRLDEAAEAYERVLSVRPSYWKALSSLAVVEEGRGRTEQALARVREAIESAPHAGELWARLGRLLEGRGEREEALDAYRRARALHAIEPGIEEAIRRLER